MKSINIMCTGVVRPDYKRVYANIINSLKAFNGYVIECNVLTYKTEEAIKLKNLLAKSHPDIKVVLIPFITENMAKAALDKMQISKGIQNGNIYRTHYTNEVLFESIANIASFDCVIRHRIDCELEYIEIPEIIEENVWYAPILPWRLPFDNLGIGTPATFKKIYNSSYKDSIKAESGELALLIAASKHNISFKDFNFKFQLYQDTNSSFMGVPQWSKKNRTFHHQDKWLTRE